MYEPVTEPKYSIKHFPLGVMIDDLDKLLVSDLPPVIKQDISDLHKQYENVINISKMWNIKNFNPTDLIIKSEQELAAMIQFRHAHKVNADTLTKKICDNIVTHEQSLFDERNKDKKSTEKKSFFSKKSTKK